MINITSDVCEAGSIVSMRTRVVPFTHWYAGGNIYSYTVRQPWQSNGPIEPVINRSLFVGGPVCFSGTQKQM
jgi:hypothetical protein